MNTRTDLLVEADKLDLALIDCALAQAEQRAPRHDCRDRRRTNMEGAIDALRGAAADLNQFAGNEGVSYLVAQRLERLATELASFRARDLLNMRAVS